MALEFDGVDIDHVNEDLADSGIWFEYELESGGPIHAFRCRHAGRSNVAYRKMIDRRMKALSRRFRNGTLPEEAAERLFAEVYASTILTDWKGVTAKGKAVPFTKDNAVAYLLARPGVFRVLREDCEDATNFREVTVEEEVGNSKTSSDGA